MTRSQNVRFATAAALAVVAAGCQQGEAPTDPPGLERPPAESPKVEPPSAVTAAPPTVVAPPSEVTAPFLVSLIAPEKAPPPGVIDLSVVVESPKGFSGATTIEVELPAGATLVRGKADETLTELPEGKTTRAFKVRTTRPLDADHPIKVVVSGSDPAGTFGARAERLFPEK